jgi:hypothetical protein
VIAAFLGLGALLAGAVWSFDTHTGAAHRTRDQLRLRLSVLYVGLGADTSPRCSHMGSAHPDATPAAQTRSFLGGSFSRSSAIDDYLSDGDVANLIEARRLLSGEDERT